MVLNTAASISFSQINSTSYFTNGNLGINTTNPTANLDVAGTINASGLSSLASITTGALSATNVSAGTLIASTGLTTGTINATGLSIFTNATVTNVSTGTLTASTGITVASAQISNADITTTSIGTARITSALLALGNSNTMGSIFTTGGNVGINTATPGSALHVAGPIASTPAGAGVHMGIDFNTYASIQLNSTIGSYIDFAAGVIDYSTRIMSMSTGNLNISNISNTCNVGINNLSPSANLDVVGTIKVSELSALANVTATNVSTGTLIATTSVTSGLLSATNVVGTSISAGTLSSTTITGANLSLSGNLNVAGTLTTVNITSTNILNTNISAGTINATGLSSLTNATVTNISTGGLNATGTSILANTYVTGPGAGVGTNGSLLVSGNDAYGHALYVASASAIGKRIGFQQTGTVGSIFAYNYTGGVPQNLALQMPGGNVGIGTESPTAKLHVAGNVILNPQSTGDHVGISWLRSSNNTDWFMYNPVGTDQLRIYNGSDRITFTPSGNVGIGTISPAATLDVVGGGIFRDRLSITANVARYHLYNNAGVAEWTFGQKSTSRSDFTLTKIVSNVESDYLTISTAGNVGIGTTSPSGMLHLNNAALFTSTGNLTCTGDVVSFGSLSDRRLKKNIETIRTEKALDIVSKLRAVTFDWKEDIFNEEKRNTSDLGFIAQEVEELIPEAVSEYTQIESGEVYKNIKHERLVPYLLSAIQYLLSKQT